MRDSSKPIFLSNHARLQLAYRGTNEKEVQEAVQESPWKDAELSRKEYKKEFPFNQKWNGKHYKTKQVRPIFADEGDKLVIVTIYVYYC